MRKKIIIYGAILILGFGVFCFAWPSGMGRKLFLEILNPKRHLAWHKAKTVKTGITREEFEKDFYLDNSGRCYVVRGCGYGLVDGICVRATFKSSDNKETERVPRPWEGTGGKVTHDDDMLVYVSEPFRIPYGVD